MRTGHANSQTSLSLPLADAVARHVESLAAKDGEGLLAASAAYRALGDRVTAADAAAQAAVAFSQSQQRRRRLYAAAIAQGLSDECGGLSTPALRSPTGHPLTERQREIVELAVAGMSNKEIATRLIMSVRSVEGHLYRACQRVGANSREELAAIIGKSTSSTDSSAISSFRQYWLLNRAPELIAGISNLLCERRSRPRRVARQHWYA